MKGAKMRHCEYYEDEFGRVDYEACAIAKAEEEEYRYQEAKEEALMKKKIKFSMEERSLATYTIRYDEDYLQNKGYDSIQKYVEEKLGGNPHADANLEIEYDGDEPIDQDTSTLVWYP